MLIHRSSVLGIELVVTTNSSDCLRAVREMEPGAPGERLAAGTLEIEFVSEGRAWSIAAGGMMLRSGSHADDPAACLQDLVAELVCERLSDFTVLPAGMATLSGQRVLFVGGQAESTALLPALLAHGADLHTDHLVLVKDGACTPFPRRFRMGKGSPAPHGSSAAFLERRVHSSAGREFRFFDPTDSGRPWNLDRGAPSVIVSLNPGGGRPVESSPIPRFAMVQQLLPTVADLARRPERTIRELSALVSACGCFSLRTATPGETATEVLRLLQAPGDGTTLPGSADRDGIAVSNANTGASVIQPDDPADYIPEDAANAASRRYDAGSGSLRHGTGALEGPHLVCRPGVHAKGHCVYGPGLFVMNAQKLRVNFHLSVGDDAPRDGRAVSLDIYDRRHGKILCHQDVAVSRVRDSPAGLPLTATVAQGQELEFRVYWHGEAEIAFSHLTASFSGIASPPGSGSATKHPEEAFREKAALRRLDALKRRDPAGFLEPEAFVEFPRAAVEQSLAARFEQQVSLHGARIAACGARRDFTYVELDGLANGIAGAILDRAGGAPGAVALLLAHDTPVCAAILGVLKAGGHYVPLDPWNPEERNAFIVADSGARLLLTDRRHRDAACALARRVGGVGVFDVEDAPAGTAVVPGVKVSPDALCFLVYTSGSTGRPKGVCQVHRNVLHTAMALTNFTGLNCGDRVSLLHSTSSVAGSTTLFGALLNGAAICPFDPGEADLDQLAGWLERERITFLSAVPTLFRRLCQRGQRGHRLEDVRLVRLVGEAATLTEWHLFNEHFPERCRLYVGLGSTEALSIRQALYDRDREPPGPILAAGGAVPDKEILLVAPDGGGVPAGGVGEIVVRSEFLFPGYWKRPDLTEQVLSDDPADRRRRIFRTGDLGKFAADGSLVHVGRADSQVKIAGQRVEVAEVEHAIRQAAPVRDAAVTLHRQGARDGRLVAFVATGGDAPPDRRELRARLREALPDHMIPVSIQFVDELPLLPGGKIDRKALAGRAQTVRAEHARPRNPIEKTLVEIFQRALDVRDVGIGDDLFLDLAGDSLAAVQILSEVKTSLGRELPLSVLYEASTVAALGARLLEEGWEPPASGTLVVHPEGAGDPLFGVCGIFGHPHRLLFVGQALDPEQPFYGLQPPDMDWERAGCGTIEAMASHYLAEIRRLQPRGPYRLLGASFGGIVAFEISVQLQRAGERVALLAMVDTMPPDGAAEDGFDPVERRDLTAGIDASNRLAAMGLRVALSHRSALDRYLPQRRFDGTIVYFRCEEPAVAEAVDRRRLWSRFATGGLRVVPVPGKHGRIHREPQLSVLTAGLRACLAAG